MNLRLLRFIDLFILFINTLKMFMNVLNYSYQIFKVFMFSSTKICTFRNPLVLFMNKLKSIREYTQCKAAKFSKYSSVCVNMYS